MRTRLIIAVSLLICGKVFGGSLKLGYLENALAASGGCSLQLPGDFARREGRFVFVSDLNKHAQINVDGATVSLTLVKIKADHADRPQTGERSTYWYQGDGWDVRVDYIVTAGCPGKEACTLTSYDAVVSVKRGKESKSVAAKAMCGSLTPEIE